MTNQKISAFYQREYSCLYCQSTFATTKIRSRFQSASEYQSDFCPVYRNNEHNPLYYFVNVCPECGFSFTEQFSKHFPQQTREVIKQKLETRWNKEDYGEKRTHNHAVTTYKLAIFSGEMKLEDPTILAGLCLRLAWLYRQKQQTEEEARFMNYALKQYLRSFTDSQLIGMEISELKILYLIGELNRRLGDLEQAVYYFSKVTQHRNRNAEPAIVKMARDQWGTVRKEKNELGSTTP